MKVTIHPTALYRIPLFPLNATLEQSWEELKKAIALSSTEFYKIIEHTSAEQIQELPQNVQHTIWKYFNRARHRCTPYATFASVGLCQIQHRSENPILTLEENSTIHSFIDWSHKDEITITLEQLKQQDLFLFSNSSYYLIPGAIRYISHLDGAFQLSDIDQNELALKILEYCTKPLRYSILSQLLKSKGIPTASVLDMVAELVDLQLLITSNHPNIIGEDYFQRIGVDPEMFENRYILSERKLQTGTLDNNLFRHLPEAINLLQQLVPQNDPEPLKEFMRRFGLKFEGQQIPLMQALDPEMGVGYGDFEITEDDSLTNKMANKKKVQQTSQADQFKQSMLNQLIQNSNATHILQLENIKPNNEQSKTFLPNSTGILLSLAGEQICIDSIGGTTANMLLGRFTLSGEEFHQHCQAIATLEQQANPEVLFFDVAYIAEGKVDNVNRRKAIYPLQLSILNYDISKEPLTLDDIMLYIQGGKLMLRSKKLKKRLVPRFSTAYNYSRSDLSLFRFLCDLQHQGIQTRLSLDLQSILPDANSYPRVQYQNIIISPAKWKISMTDLKQQHIEQLQSYLKSKAIGQFFKAGSGDMTLFYDQQNPMDMQALLTTLTKQKSLYIEEAFPQTGNPITDHKQDPYACQLLLSLNHSEEIYKEIPIAPIKQPHPDVKKTIAPGKDWLYFEIYSHAHRTEEILFGPIAHLLETQKDKIEKWFFIRYNENGDHLRLRIKLNNPSQGYELIRALTELLDEYLESGMISELLLKTYKRETHRYGWKTMDAIESHFSKDSQYVLSLLTDTFTDQQKYRLCIGLLQEIQESEALSQKEFSYITNKVSSSFNDEHQLKPEDFKELNNLYKTFRNEPTPSLDNSQEQAQKQFINSFINAISLFETIEKRSALSDLFHMHVNRLFTNNQRTHEMIIYYFLTKEMQRIQAAKKQVHLSQTAM